MCANDALQTRVCDGHGLRDETRQVMVDVGWESEVMDEAGPHATGVQREQVWEVVAEKETAMARDCIR